MLEDTCYSQLPTFQLSIYWEKECESSLSIFVSLWYYNTISCLFPKISHFESRGYLELSRKVPKILFHQYLEDPEVRGSTFFQNNVNIYHITQHYIQEDIKGKR
jgi:hypothetical protein